MLATTTTGADETMGEETDATIARSYAEAEIAAVRSGILARDYEYREDFATPDAWREEAHEALATVRAEGPIDETTFVETFCAVCVELAPGLRVAELWRGARNGCRNGLAECIAAAREGRLYAVDTQNAGVDSLVVEDSEDDALAGVAEHCVNDEVEGNDFAAWARSKRWTATRVGR